jgi:hypothetical protein
MDEELITIEDLKERWHQENARAVRRIVKRYEHLIHPMKFGRVWLFHPDDVQRFEDQLRIINDGEDNGSKDQS